MTTSLRVWITTPSKVDAEQVALILANKGFQIGALGSDGNVVSGDNPGIGAYRVTSDKEVTPADLRDIIKDGLLRAKARWYSLIVSGDGGGAGWSGGVTKIALSDAQEESPPAEAPKPKPAHSSHPTPPEEQIRMVYPGHMGLDLDLILMDDTQKPWRAEKHLPLVRNYGDFHKLGMKDGADDTSAMPFQTLTPGEGESSIMTDGYGAVMYVPAKTFNDVHLSGSYMNMNIVEQLRRARPDQPVLLFWH